MAITPVTTQTLFSQWRLITNAIITAVGDNDALSTTDKSSLVAALNEVAGLIGDLTTLTTTAQDSVVNAINEVFNAVGDLTTLTTTAQDSVVNAIIELVSAIGTLASLTTTEKGSLVGAINEIDTISGDLNALTTTVKGDAIYSVNINTGGTGYTAGDVLTVIAGNSDATLTVVTEAAGVITSVSVSSGGTGYSNAVGVSVSGGTGLNATFDIFVGTLSDAINEVNALAVNSLALSNIQINNLEANKGRFSTNAVSNVDVVTPGTITSISVDTAGSGYTVAPTVDIVGDGTGATATAVLAATGSVKSIVLNNAGSGYTVSDVLTITGGNSDATVTVDTVGGSGEITGYSLTSGGTGYTNGTNVATTGGTGTLATFDTTVGFAVASIGVDTAGSGYLVATVNITGDGSGASATASIDSAHTFSIAGTTLQTHNSASLVQGDVFYDDNSTNGGASVALTANISDLLTAMSRTDLRYGHEFYVLDITAGSDVVDGQLLALNSQNYYPVVQNNRIFLSRAGNVVTWSGWIKVQSVNDAPTFTGIVIGDANVATYIDGGVMETVPKLLTVADGWTHVRQTITLTKEYNNIFPAIYANNLDNVYVALPVLLDGDINIGMHEGIV